MATKQAVDARESGYVQAALGSIFDKASKVHLLAHSSYSRNYTSGESLGRPGREWKTDMYRRARLVEYT